jgi:hypothetical protein
MPETLPRARARVVTRAGLLARPWVTSVIDFHFSYRTHGQIGQSLPETHAAQEKSAGDGPRSEIGA